MSTAVKDNWWTRPCGGRELMTLALPLIVSTGSWALMHFCDRMFLLWHSTTEVAAAMPAGILHFSMICFPLGIAAYVNTFVAQYHGAGRPERIGLAVWQGVGIGFLAMPVFLAVIPFVPWIFRVVGHDPAIAAAETTYFRILSLGAGGAVIATAMSSFFTGRGQTRVVMVVAVSSSLLNIVLDYAWVFGHWGFPEGGIAGAAWATVVAQWARVIAYWRLLMLPAYRDAYQMVEGRRFDPALFRRLLYYGGPNGLQMLVEVAAFALFLLLIGKLGEHALAATTLAFNVNTVAFVPMLGMGIAVSTIVGQQLGRHRDDRAARATWTAFAMAAAYMGTLGLLYVIVPDLFLMGYASGTSPERFEHLRETTTVLLRFVAAYALFDAANLIFVSAIKGAGDTRFVLATNIIMSPLPVLVGWYGVTRLDWNVVACWGVITAWICMLGLIYFTRFLQGRWREMRVIEAELPEAEHAVIPDEVPPELLEVDRP